MSLVHINWKPGAADLRKFGVAMIVGFGIIGLLMQFAAHKPATAYGCYGFGAAAGLLGLSGTRAALPVYWAWMGVAFVMGNIMSRVLLAAFYFGMITPMGWTMRLIGRDKLRLRKPATASYWTDLPPPAAPTSHERQF